MSNTNYTQGPIEKAGLYWKIHTPNLLKEILINVSDKNKGALRVPIKQFGDQLYELAELAQEIDDPRLHLMMCRFTLYTCADPDSEDYESGIYDTLEKRIKNYKPVNDELLEALENMVELYEEVQPAGGWQGYYEQATDAIARARK